MTATGNPSLVMRLATPVDLGMIHYLLTEDGLPLDGVAENLHNVVVGELKGAIVATAAVELHGEVGLVRSVAVHGPHRGVGHGARIVRASVQRARSKGVREFYLLTMSASPFFQRLGFLAVERDEAPDAIQCTREFVHLCPSTAVLMRCG